MPLLIKKGHKYVSRRCWSALKWLFLKIKTILKNKHDPAILNVLFNILEFNFTLKIIIILNVCYITIHRNYGVYIIIIEMNNTNTQLSLIPI